MAFVAANSFLLLFNSQIDVRRFVEACRELKIPLLHYAVKEIDTVEFDGYAITLFNASLK